MPDLEQQLITYSAKTLDQKKTWYSDVANAYNQSRPRYPEALIDRAIAMAHLSPDASILEIGCGPGNATIAFAQRDFTITAIEPNPELCQLLRENCSRSSSPYPKVKILNTSFEEWPLEAAQFTVVLAANAFHWISPDIACPKAAAALKNDGWLLLLWNMNPEPSYDAYQLLRPVYERHAPQLIRYEGREKQYEIQQQLGQKILQSGCFSTVSGHQIVCDVTYSAEEYVMLLNTFSPYKTLDSQVREALFAGLSAAIAQHFNGSLHCSYLSACHLAQKRQSSSLP